jgi:hypothetical protein
VSREFGIVTFDQLRHRVARGFGVIAQFVGRV